MTGSPQSSGFRFSLGEFLTGATAIAAACAGFLEFGLWGAGAILAAVGIVALIRGRRTGRRWLSGCGALQSLVAVGLLGLALLDWMVFGEGPVFRAESFPGELRGMMTAAEVDAADVRVHCRGRFIDAEYVWRMRMSGPQFERLAREYDLRPVATGRAPNDFWRAFPLWWRPRRNTEPRVRIRATADFPDHGASSHGNHFFAMYDDSQSQLYVWHKSHSD